MKKYKVLIVDDSALVRQSLTKVMEMDPEIEVIATASDPYYAVKKIKAQLPDVIALDINMPRMDGLTFLKKIMAQFPIPVVIISSITTEGSDAIFEAFEYGAIEVITKPKLNTREFIEESKIRICDAIKSAAHSKINRNIVKEKNTKENKKEYFTANIGKQSNKIVVMGASAGGTEAIYTVLKDLPVNLPGIVIVQHMPKEFTVSFAKRLNDSCALNVKEAGIGDIIKTGHAYIAPGNLHIRVFRKNGMYAIETFNGPLINRHRPSVNVLFHSAVKAEKDVTAILLTGMGNDGAYGLKEIRDAGGNTIAQDEKSCVVFGMPKEAIKLGAAKIVLPLENIAAEIMKIKS